MVQKSPVDVYIAAYSGDVAARLQRIRHAVQALCPDAKETMSYGMPAYKLLGKPLIYFAAFQKHIGVYATPSGHTAFVKELAHYKQGKGSVQFPLDEELPIGLIERMIQRNAHNIIQK